MMSRCAQYRLSGPILSEVVRLEGPVVWGGPIGCGPLYPQQTKGIAVILAKRS